MRLHPTLRAAQRVLLCSSFWLLLVSPGAAIEQAALDEVHRAYLNTVEAIQTSPPEEALQIAIQFRNLVRGYLGEDHDFYRLGLDSVGKCLSDAGRPKEALPLLQQALQSTPPGQMAARANRLNSLALCREALGEYSKAIELFAQAEALCRQLGDANAALHAVVLNNYASSLQLSGSFDQAFEVSVEAVAKAAEAFGRDQPWYAVSLSTKGACLQALGRYAEALPVLREAIDITREVSGETSEAYPVRLNNLAICLDALGRYDEALPLLQEARSRLEEAELTHTEDYGTVLSSLAVCLGSMGLHDEALPVHREALQHAKTALGPSHPEYGSRLSSLAACLTALGRHEEALPIYRQALAHAETHLTSHPDFAARLNDSALSLVHLGRSEEALPIFRQAVTVAERTTGRRHPEFFNSLSNFALCHDALGKHLEALPLHREVVAGAEETYGRDHPAMGPFLNNLAFCLRHLERFEEASVFAREALELTRRTLRRDAVFRSERDQLQAAHRLRHNLDLFLSIPSVPPEASFLEILGWKGSVLTRQRATRQVASDPQVSELFAALQQVAAELASWAGELPDNPESLEAWRSRLQELTHEQQRLERELSSASHTFASTARELSIEEIVASLPEPSVLVDYLVYNDSGEDRLLAHLVFSEASVQRFELGSMETVRQSVEAWRGALTARSPGADEGRALRALIWDPIAEQVAARRQVFVCPDDALGTIPFSALPGDNQDTYLIEDYAIALIPVPQLLPLLFSEDTGSTASGGLLTIGDVDYDEPPADAKSSARPAARNRGRPGSVRTELPSHVRGSRSFGRLEGTRTEVNDITMLYSDFVADRPVTRLTRGQASEGHIKEIAGEHSILHIATHGFFAPPEAGLNLFPNSRDGSLAPLILSNRARSSIAELDPNLLSGLALSGANLPAEPEREDGILTAREVAFLPLEHVDLVTLSACETGLGEVAGGEGLLGLQRAFQVSGARTTIASLWKVDDKVTRMLMVRFYQNIWEHGMSKLEALREAQLSILRDPASIRGLHSNSPTEPSRTPPYYWASFQLSGDWR